MAAVGESGPQPDSDDPYARLGLSAGAIGGQYASANRALQFDNLRLRTPLLAP